MLFTVNHSSMTSKSFDSLLKILPAGSPILFFEDGVYNALAGSSSEVHVKEALKTNPIFALDADIEARGLKGIIEGIKKIGYDGFVELVEKHDMVPWI